MLEYFFAIISIIYFMIIYFFWVGLFRLKKPKKNKKDSDFKGISVIISARNEEDNIASLIENLCEQNYPNNNYEIIIANDRSTDNTLNLIKKYIIKYEHLKYIDVESSEELIGKKNALEQAILRSKYDILAFTDADCLPHKNWINEINEHYTGETDFVAGYSPLILPEIKFESKVKELWYRFINAIKNLERISIFSITAGSFGWNLAITCTARNMSYRKELYGKVNGFSGIGHILSGDDDLMLQKMTKFIKKMNFMFSQDSIVISKDKTDWESQINQETRRASKWKYYPLSIKLLTLFIFVYYIIFVFILATGLLGNFSANIFLFLLSLKIFPEFLLIFTFLIKIKRIWMILLFPVSEIIYIPYYIFFALRGVFSKYKWKN